MVLRSGGPAELGDEFRTQLNPFWRRRVASACVDGAASDRGQWNSGQFRKRIIVGYQKGERLEPHEVPGQLPREGLVPACTTPEGDIDPVHEQCGHRRTESTVKAAVER
jgi:hypothetical protein